MEDSDIYPPMNTIAPICSAANAVFTRYAEVTAEDENDNFEEDSDQESLISVAGTTYNIAWWRRRQ